jgi:hypothetical protein
METNPADEKASAVANAIIGAGEPQANFEKYLKYLKNGGLFNLHECSDEIKRNAFCAFITVNVRDTLKNKSIDNFYKPDVLSLIMSRINKYDPKTHQGLLKDGKLAESIIRGCIPDDNDARAFMNNVEIISHFLYRYCDFGDYRDILTDLRYHPSVTKIFQKHIFSNPFKVSHAYFTFEAIKESLNFFKRNNIKKITEPGCGSGYLGLLLQRLLKSLDKHSFYYPYSGVELKESNNGGYLNDEKMQRLIRKITNPNDFSYLESLAKSGGCLFISYAPDEKAHKSLMGVNVLKNYYSLCQFYKKTPKVMVISESDTTDGPLFREFLKKHFEKEGKKIPLQGFMQDNHPFLRFYIGKPDNFIEQTHGFFL